VLLPGHEVVKVEDQHLLSPEEPKPALQVASVQSSLLVLIFLSADCLVEALRLLLRVVSLHVAIVRERPLDGIP
jgi:hypothetical protein